jgi:hypothetical protein
MPTTPKHIQDIADQIRRTGSCIRQYDPRDAQQAYDDQEGRVDAFRREVERLRALLADKESAIAALKASVAALQAVVYSRAHTAVALSPETDPDAFAEIDLAHPCESCGASIGAPCRPDCPETYDPHIPHPARGLR